MTIPARLRTAVLQRDGNRCHYCGRRPPEVVLEADHVHPRARGGSSIDTNLVAACSTCNGDKADRVLTDPPRPEPLGVVRRQQGGPIRDTGLRLGRLRWCADACPVCAATTQPRHLIDGDARTVQLAYRCATGHPWQAWWTLHLATIHADAVRWNAHGCPA